MLTHPDTLPAPLALCSCCPHVALCCPVPQRFDDLLLSRHCCLPFPTPRLPFLPCIYLVTGLYSPQNFGEKRTQPCQGPTLGHSWGWSSPCHPGCHLLSWSENLHHLPRFLLILSKYHLLAAAGSKGGSARVEESLRDGGTVLSCSTTQRWPH